MPDTLEVIEGGYLRDILAQPQALQDTLAQLDPAVLADITRRLAQGGFSRIVLTAMGGSYFALYPLHLSLLRRRLPSLLLETAELIHYAPAILDAGTLLIVVSQSGRSAEIVRLLDVKHADCLTLAVCNTPGSPLAARAAAVVMTQAGQEFTVSCKTYVTALLALQWVGDVLVGLDPVHSKEELSTAAPAVASYLQAWRDHVRDAAAEFSGVGRLFMLGRGSSLATAWIAGLTTKESTHFHAEGMTAAAFRHGPFEMLDPSLYALVFEGDDATAALNRTLVHDIQAAGARAALAGETGTPPLFRLPRVPAPVRPIVEVLPVQMMTLALAAMAGREAGKFERATKVTETE